MMPKDKLAGIQERRTRFFPHTVMGSYVKNVQRL
jgi:hypothetical protein